MLQGRLHPSHLGEKHPGILRALGGVPCGGPGHQRVEVGRDRARGPIARRCRHVVVHVRVRDLDRRLAGVRLAAGEQLEQHDPGAVDVRPGIRTAGQHQLGRQVGHGADQQTLGGRRRLGRDGLGQPEVGDLELAPIADQHVLRLDVAVHQPRVVGAGQGGEHRLDQLQRPERGHGCLPVDHVAQGPTVDVLHHDVGPAHVPVQPVLTLVEDRDNVRMRELGRGPGLAVELAGELGVVTQTDVHHLDRDGPRQPGVHRLIDRRHAASGEALGDLIATVQQLPDQGVANCGHGHICSEHGGEVGRVGRALECKSVLGRSRPRRAGQPRELITHPEADPLGLRWGPFGPGGHRAGTLRATSASRFVLHGSRMPPRTGEPESDRPAGPVVRPARRASSPRPSGPGARPG